MTSGHWMNNQIYKRGDCLNKQGDHPVAVFKYLQSS